MAKSKLDAVIDHYHECVDSWLDMIPALSAHLANILIYRYDRISDYDGRTYGEGDEMSLSKQLDFMFWHDDGLTFDVMIRLCDLKPAEVGKIMWRENQEKIVDHVICTLKYKDWTLENT